MFETTVLQRYSPDGERELEIALLSNGMYQFTEWAKRVGDEYTGEYAAVEYLSGLYATLVEAEADAQQILPWLRDQNSN